MIRQVGIGWDYIAGERQEAAGGPDQLLLRAMAFEAKHSPKVDALGGLLAFWDSASEPAGSPEAVGRGDLPAKPACHSAISGRAQENRQNSHITGGGKVAIARGGRLLKLQVHSAQRKEGRGRGRERERGKVSGFSPRSRMRLLEVINTIDQGAAAGSRWRFVTLTYHNVKPDQVPASPHLHRLTSRGVEQVIPRQCKKHLRAFLKQLYREFGPVGVIWKLEPQKRGMPHFHLLLLLPHTWGVKVTPLDTPASIEQKQAALVEQEREWFARAWVDVTNGTEEQYRVHRYDKREDKAGWQVIENWEQVSGYCGKYVGKVVDVPNESDWAEAGRWWGIENRHMLPISVATALLNAAQTVRLQRVMRRWAESKRGDVFQLINAQGTPFFGDDGKALTTTADWKRRKAMRTPFDGHMGLRLRRKRAFIGKHFGGRAFMPAAEAWRMIEWALGDCVEFSGDEPPASPGIECPF